MVKIVSFVQFYVSLANSKILFLYTKLRLYDYKAVKYGKREIIYRNIELWMERIIPNMSSAVSNMERIQKWKG